jgi:hypothetical protein
MQLVRAVWLVFCQRNEPKTPITWIHMPLFSGFFAAQFVSSCLRVRCFAGDRFANSRQGLPRFAPKKNLEIRSKNLRKPQQKPASSTLVNPLRQRSWLDRR